MATRIKTVLLVTLLILITSASEIYAQESQNGIPQTRAEGSTSRFTRLTTDLDEWAELADGNQSVAALMAGVVLAVALLTATAVERIVVALTEAIF